jgi:hypothetical protein
MKCKICNENIQLNVFGIHLKKYHNLTTKEYYLRYVDNNNKCYCGNEKHFLGINKGYSKYCSCKCAGNDKKLQEKRKMTCKIKYGVNNISQSDFIKNKKKETFIKNYGIDNPLKLNQIQEKRKKTNLKKYGYESHNTNEQIKEKKKNVNRTKTLYKILYTNIVEPLFDITDWLNKIKKYEKFKWKCKKCNHEFEDWYSNGILPRCTNCFPKTVKNFSSYEKEISLWLNELNIKHEVLNKTLIYPLELDIVIPEYKLAIEFNGLYWHSELNGKNINYHLNKTKLCEAKDYQLIHIFEDEWIEKSDIVKSIIKSKLGLYEQKIGARKCIIKKLKYSNVELFLNENHIQGSIKSSINYGLFYQNGLVAVATFCKSRFRKNNSFELLRFCTKQNIQIIGGLSKLISLFKKENNKKIISYCDKRYSNGKGYLASGFIKSHESSPNYWYLNKRCSNRISRLKFQKHKLKDILEIYDSNLTEWQNMQLNNYNRIWDCGNLVFEI